MAPPYGRTLDQREALFRSGLHFGIEPCRLHMTSWLSQQERRARLAHCRNFFCPVHASVREGPTPISRRIFAGWSSSGTSW